MIKKDFFIIKIKMGNKVLCGKNKEKNSDILKEFNLKNLDYPLTFLIELKRIKGINLKIEDVFLEFDIFGIKRLKTKIVYNSINPIWILNENLTYEVKSKEDLTKNLLIKIFSKKFKYLGNIQISFLELALGTIRNNFVFNSFNRYIGRLQFDIKISQHIEIIMEIEKLNLSFYDINKKVHTNDLGEFSFKLFLDKYSQNLEQEKGISFKDFSENTEVVDNFKIDVYNFDWEYYDYDKKHYALEMDKIDEDLNRSLNEVLKTHQETHKKLLAIDSNDDLELEKINKVESIAKSKFLIKPKNKLKNKTSISNYYDQRISLTFNGRTDKFHDTHIVFKLFNEQEQYIAIGYFSLDTFFHHKGDIIESQNEFFNQIKINIWKYGHFIGKLDVFLILRNKYFLRQNSTGITTEEGTFFSEDLLPFKKIKNSHSKSYDNELTKMLKFYKEEIKVLIFEDQKIIDEENLETEKVLKVLNDFKKDLVNKLKNSNQAFKKKNEILEFQSSIMELIIIFIKFLKDIDMSKNEKKVAIDCFKILMKREELNFRSMDKKIISQRFLFEKAGNRKLNDNNFFNNKSLKAIQRKKNMLFEFIKLMEKLFEYFQIKITLEENDNYEIELLSFIMVHFYLKNQIFQENLLSIFEKTFKEKGIIYQNYTFYDDKYEIFISNKNLFSILEKDEEGQKKLLKLNEKFSQENFYKNLTNSKKHITNLFLKKLFLYFHKEFITKNYLSWNDLKGYNKLVHYIYYEIHEIQNLKQIEENNLKDVILASVINNLQLNLFLPLLITKTNLRDPNQLDIFYELIAFKFNSVIVDKKRDSFYFDFHLFIKLLIMVLDEDHLIPLEKTLLLLYKYSNILGKDFKKLIFQYFENPNQFYRFFLHWSFSIRKIFYYFLIFNYSDEKEYLDKIINMKDEVMKGNQIYINLLIQNRVPDNKKKKKKNISKIDSPINKNLLVYTQRALFEYNQTFSNYKIWIDSIDPFKNEDKLNIVPDIGLKVLKDYSEFKI